MSPFYKIHLRMFALLVMPTLLIAESEAVTRVDAAPSVVVRYHDLNLDTPEGVANLYQRIHAAAVDVCKSVEGPRLVNRLFWTEWNNCTNHAVAEAVKAVHN